MDRNPERLNWADVTFIALTVPRVVGGLVHDFALLAQEAAAKRSVAIDARKRFAREAKADIEILTGGAR